MGVRDAGRAGLPDSWVPTSNRRLFILLPGNPGIVQFYQAFVRELAEGHAMDVLVMGFAGHSLDNHNGPRLFTLQDQIEVADQFLHAVLSGPAINKYAGNVYVGGHSIGGYVALHMLARHRESIKLYFGLCPVLSHILDSPNGQGMFFFATPVLQWVAAFVGSLFALLPYPLRRRVISWRAPTLGAGMQAALAAYVSCAALMNVFSLTFDEFRCVTRPDRYLLRSLQEKMCLYYVPGDGWAPPAHAEEIRKLCPRLKSFIMEQDASVPHAWCLEHTTDVVQNGIAKLVR